MPTAKPRRAWSLRPITSVRTRIDRTCVRRILPVLGFLLVLTACGGDTAEPQVDALRGLDGELISDDDFTAAPPVSEPPVSDVDTSAPGALALSENDKPKSKTLGGNAAPGSPSHRCGASGAIEVGKLTDGAAPKFVIVAPAGLIEPGDLRTVPDTPDEGQGVTLCIDEIPNADNFASCGVTLADGDLVLYEQHARRVTFTWLSEGNDSRSYTSPPALLFDDCPDLDTSDPLLRPNAGSLPTLVVEPTIPALRIEDAFTTSMIGFLRVDDEPLTARQCGALTLSAERGELAVESLYSAYHPQAVPYPSNIEYSAANVANARTATESFLDANAVAIGQLEGNGLQFIHQRIHLNGIVWRRLLNNLDEDLSTNGETWFRWKLGRQVGVGHGLSNTAHHIAVLGDVARSLCEGVESTPDQNDQEAVAMCVAVADMYQSRYDSRLVSRQGEDNYHESRGMSDGYFELAEQYPANSNPFVSDDALVALLNTEGDLNSEIRDIWPIGVRVIPWIDDLEELHTFARTCPQIPSEHIELPTILEELGITPEELLQGEEDSLLNYADFDVASFTTTIQSLSAPEGWRFTTGTLDSKLGELLEGRTQTSISFGFLSSNPDDIFNTEIFTDVGPAVHEMMTTAGFERTAVICDTDEEFEYLYESSDGSTGTVYASGWIGFAPPAFIDFELPGQTPADRISGCT